MRVHELTQAVLTSPFSRCDGDGRVVIVIEVFAPPYCESARKPAPLAKASGKM